MMPVVLRCAGSQFVIHGDSWPGFLNFSASSTAALADYHFAESAETRPFRMPNGASGVLGPTALWCCAQR
jgi:hypothetical protein